MTRSPTTQAEATAMGRDAGRQWILAHWGIPILRRVAYCVAPPFIEAFANAYERQLDRAHEAGLI